MIPEIAENGPSVESLRGAVDSYVNDLRNVSTNFETGPEPLTLFLSSLNKLLDQQKQNMMAVIESVTAGSSIVVGTARLLAIQQEFATRLARFISPQIIESGPTAEALIRDNLVDKFMAVYEKWRHSRSESYFYIYGGSSEVYLADKRSNGRERVDVDSETVRVFHALGLLERQTRGDLETYTLSCPRAQGVRDYLQLNLPEVEK